ncbi:TPA: hypothetical protein EYP84_02215 [Candidatus Bipolaricaulota bacterium]|nr:hypothetical protein [Candidatus Bipolaricaulota bacterium]
MRKSGGLIFGFLLAFGLCSFGQHFYAFYYDVSGSQDVSVNLLNTMTSDTGYLLKVYDAWGNLLWSKTGILTGYEADYYVLSDYVPRQDSSWGVATVESDDLLIIGLEYMADGTVVSIDTISQGVPKLDPGVPYWLGAYYTQAGDITTGVIVMNPWEVAVSVTVTIYGPAGDRLYQMDVALGPYESEFIDLEAVVGRGGLIWGLVDVMMTDLPVVMALEYYGEILDVKNVTEYYF